MLLGHLMLGLLGGIAAAAIALAAGLSLWMAVLLWIVVANLLTLASAALALLADHPQEPPSHRAKASGRDAKLRVVHAHH